MIRRRDKMEALSVDIERKVRALVDAGYYSNKSEVIKNAVIIMSLAYKENVPDTRESPVREMVKRMFDAGEATRNGTGQRKLPIKIFF